jgi:hypothetical protein
MPAPSTEHVYDLKTALCTATSQILAEGGFAQVVLERETTRLKTALRYEISFDLGEAMNQHTLDNGELVYDYFAGTLRLRLVSSRRPLAPIMEHPVRELHDRFVARTLALLEERRYPYRGILAWHEVKKLRPMGAQYGFDPQFIEDFTDMAFATEVGIKSDAWPG